MIEIHRAWPGERGQTFHSLSRCTTLPSPHMFPNLEALWTLSFGFLVRLHYKRMTQSLAIGNGFNLQPLCPPQRLGVGTERSHPLITWLALLASSHPPSVGSICAGVCICYKSVPTQSSFCCRKINHLFQVAVSFASGILLLTSLSKIKATLTYPLPYAIFLSCWTAYYIYWVLFLLLSHRPDMNWSMEMFSSLCKTTEQVALDSEGWGKAYPKVKMSPHTGLWQTLLSYSICIEIN